MINYYYLNAFVLFVFFFFLAIVIFRVFFRFRERKTTAALSDNGYLTLKEAEPQSLITDEILRARHYQRSFSVLVVKCPSEESPSPINHEHWKRVCINILRTIDTVITDYGSDLVVIVCPETGLYNARVALARLQAAVSQDFGFVPRFGAATFPEDGITSAALMDHALTQLQRESRPRPLPHPVHRPEGEAA